MHDIILLGGGPAGLAAAAYAKAKQLDFLLVADEIGGKLGWLERWGGPPAWPAAGSTVAQLLADQAVLSGDRILADQVLQLVTTADGFELTTAHHGLLQARAVIVATGASPLKLALPGATRFLGSGLCYSVSTYGHLAVAKHVAVIGGSARALANTAELARTAARVVLVAPVDGVASSSLGQTLLQQPNVEIRDRSEVIAIEGHSSVESITIARDGRTEQIEVDMIYVAMGLVPNSYLVRTLVETDAHGFILVNSFYETSLPGLYAAGDVSSMFSEHVMTALGDGTRAAMSAHEYLLSHWLAEPKVFSPTAGVPLPLAPDNK